MKYIAVFDIGTTSVKGVLIDDRANLKGEYSVLLETHYGPNGEIEQNPEDWWAALKEITARWWDELLINAKQIAMLTFTGQMEDVVPICGDHSNPNAILYSDTRAKEEAEKITQAFPEIKEVTGNTIRASTPMAKLLWLHKRNIYSEANCFVFSAKDYIIYKLANVLVTDPTTGATTGMMNLKDRRWERTIIERTGVNLAKLPKIYKPDEVIGFISKEASYETGFCKDTAVLCGCGDAGASTLGAGAIKHGDSHLYLGTTGWVAVVQDELSVKQQDNEVFLLAHVLENNTISIAPLLNVGNVHHWAVETFVDADCENKYEHAERTINQVTPGSDGLLFLPYLNGERYPVIDQHAKGAFWGIGPTTKKDNFLRAVLEGVSYALKQVLENLSTNGSGTITVIGGGTKSKTWCQILADCLGRAIIVPSNSKYMPAIGAAATAFVNLGWANDYYDFTKRFIENEISIIYYPEQKNVALYHEYYQRFLKLYPHMQGIYK